MTRHNVIYVKALFSRDFPLVKVVPGTCCQIEQIYKVNLAYRQLVEFY